VKTHHKLLQQVLRFERRSCHPGHVILSALKCIRIWQKKYRPRNPGKGSAKSEAMFRICGPKLSLCGLLLSIWGILQLGLMSLLFYFRSVAFVEDLKVEETDGMNGDQLYQEIDKAYGDAARNCLITTACYGFTLLLSAHQFWVNSKAGGGGASSGPPSPANRYRTFNNET